MTDMKGSTVSRMKKAPLQPQRARQRLWRCPRCGRSFANRHQSHFCGSQRTLEDHFAGRPTALRLLFARLLEGVQACGPVPLQPVMGAFAHLMTFDEGRSGFAHLHPLQVDLNQPLDPLRPRLAFKVQIPRAGRYVI